MATDLSHASSAPALADDTGTHQEGGRTASAPRDWWWSVPALLGLALIVGGIARIARIGSESLWGDESYTIAIAQRGFGGMLDLFTKEPNGLLYYLFIYPVSRLDPGVTALRIPSAMLGILAILLIYWVGALLGDRWTGLLAAAFMALSPLAVEYSQQGRFYTLALVFATLSFGLLVKALRTGDTRWWIAYIVATAALSYCSTLGALLIAVPEAVFVASYGARAIRRWALWLVGVVALLIPLGVLSAVVLDERDPLYFLDKPAPREILEMWRTMFGGTAILGVVLLSLAAAIVLALRRGWRPEKRAVLGHPLTIFAAWSVLPILAAFVISWVVHPVFVSRFVIAALPGACLLGAAAIRRLPLPAAAIALAAVLALSANQVIKERGGPGEDHRSADAVLASERAPGEPVLFDTAPGLIVAGHYDRSLAGPDGRLVVSEWQDAPMPQGAMVFDDPGGYHKAPVGPPSAALVSRLAAQSGRVWIVFSEVGPDQGDVLSKGGVAWARRNCTVDVRSFSGVDLVEISSCRTRAS